MSDYFKNLMIGVFVIAAILILSYIIVFLHPSVGDEGQTLYVRFDNIDKIDEGTRVTFAGRPVGSVVSIKEIDRPRLKAKDEKGVVYVYELQLQIDSSVSVYSTDEIEVKTSGLFGEKSVEINPVPPKEGQTLKRVTERDVLYAKAGGSLEQAFNEFETLAKKGADFLDKLSGIVDELNEGKFIKNLNKSMRNIGNITTALNQPDTYKNILASANEIADKTNAIITKINEGKGSVGRFISKDDFYLRTQSVISKAETIMDDINHYGLLFQNDKSWQRLRARRANLMQKLSSAQEFRNYFNDEINMVSTSLSRVYSILDETENKIPKHCLMSDIQFQEAFGELLRRIQEIEENLQNYNQQLVDINNQCCPPSAKFLNNNKEGEKL